MWGMEIKRVIEGANFDWSKLYACMETSKRDPFVQLMHNNNIDIENIIYFL
jgi:hypothetical protein